MASKQQLQQQNYPLRWAVVLGAILVFVQLICSTSSIELVANNVPEQTKNKTQTVLKLAQTNKQETSLETPNKQTSSPISTNLSRSSKDSTSPTSNKSKSLQRRQLNGDLDTAAGHEHHGYMLVKKKPKKQKHKKIKIKSYEKKYKTKYKKVKVPYKKVTYKKKKTKGYLIKKPHHHHHR